MGREITFYPETERNRDLVYSEYTSCDRSVHVLIQDGGAERYRFLLDAYRDVVAHYLSFDAIEPPVLFLRHVSHQLEAHAESLRFSLESLQDVGIFVLLRAADAYYLLASREDHVFLHEPDRVAALRDVEDGIEALRLADRDAQEELFPQRLTDRMSMFRIDAHRLEGCDLVIGCGEEDKSAVIETLTDPMRVAAMRSGDVRPIRAAVSSSFVTRKIMAVSLDPEGMVAAEDTARPERIKANSATVKRLAIVTGVAVMIFAAVMWGRNVVIPALEEQRGAGVRAPAAPERIDEVLIEQSPGSDADVSQDADAVVAASGRPQLEDLWAIEFTSPVTSSPTVYESAVVFGCRDSSVYALDRATGETRWRYRTADGVGASPVTLEGLVLGADYKGNVFAIDVESGQQRWTRRLPGKVVSSPCVAGTRVVVGCYDGYVYCLDGRTGDQLWKQSCGGRIRANVATDGVRFFVPSYSGDLHALSGETGRELWRYPVGGNLSGGAIHAGGTVYVGGPDGRLHAVSAETGKADWTAKLGGALKSAVTVGSGRVYVGSNDRNVYCVNAGSGKVIWRFQTGGIVLSAPTLQHGALFVGSYDGKLYCLDAITGALLDEVDSAGEIYSSPLVHGNNVYFGNNKGRFLSVVYRL